MKFCFARSACPAQHHYLKLRMRKYTLFLVSILVWCVQSVHADDLYNRLSSLEDVQVGQEYILVSSDRTSMLTYENKAYGALSTGYDWYASDEGIVVPFDNSDQPALLCLIAVGDKYILYFKGTETCLYATGSKNNNPKLSTVQYDEALANDTRALWKIESAEGALVLRSVSVGYCIIYANLTFKLTAKSKSNYYANVYRKEGEGVLVPSSEYLSYVTQSAVDFTLTEGLTACQVTYATKFGVLLVPVDQAPAHTAVVLHAAKGTYAIREAQQPVEPLTDNLMRASDGSKSHRADGATFYMLDSKLSHGVGFYLVKKDDIVPERIGYLIIRDQNDGRDFIPLTDHQPAGINAFGNSRLVDRHSVYDLQGRRVDGRLPMGITIVGGKKVLR